MKNDYYCTKCGGFVPEPNVVYGFAGKYCYCTVPTPPENTKDNKCCEKCTDGSTSGIWCNNETCECHAITPESPSSVDEMVEDGGIVYEATIPEKKLLLELVYKVYEAGKSRDGGIFFDARREILKTVYATQSKSINIAIQQQRAMCPKKDDVELWLLRLHNEPSRFNVEMAMKHLYES